ncbi:hypothetical protein GEMRC1_008364 [Eukaryota sp. GEM-RC1]
MSRRPFFGGNWKCNGTVESVEKHVATLNKATLDPNVDIVVCPSYLHIHYTMTKIKDQIKVGAQDCSLYSYGAYTGAINSEMLKDYGLSGAAAKAAKAIGDGLSVIFCFGESLEEFKAGKTNEVVEQQLAPLFEKLSVEQWDKVVLAYEPVYAIGTGLVCDTQQAQSTHSFIRQLVGKTSSDVAGKVRIIYGGSVKASNAVELASQSDIDGFLVGGASLKPEFADICNSKRA